MNSLTMRHKEAPTFELRKDGDSVFETRMPALRGQVVLGVSLRSRGQIESVDQALSAVDSRGRRFNPETGESVPELNERVNRYMWAVMTQGVEEPWVTGEVEMFNSERSASHATAIAIREKLVAQQSFVNLIEEMERINPDICDLYHQVSGRPMPFKKLYGERDWVNYDLAIKFMNAQSFRRMDEELLKDMELRQVSSDESETGAMWVTTPESDRRIEMLFRLLSPQERELNIVGRMFRRNDAPTTWTKVPLGHISNESDNTAGIVPLSAIAGQGKDR